MSVSRRKICQALTCNIVARRSRIVLFLDIRRRIELIQDFDMPGVSTSLKVSKDGQYILATGIYKPRVKCFDVNNLSLKFERCFDSEVVTFQILSDDYSKVGTGVLLKHTSFLCRTCIYIHIFLLSSWFSYTAIVT